MLHCAGGTSCAVVDAWGEWQCRVYNATLTTAIGEPAMKRLTYNATLKYTRTGETWAREYAH